MSAKTPNNLLPLISYSPDNSENWRTTLLAAGCFIWELAAFIVYSNEWISLPTLLLIHVLTVLIVLQHVYLSNQKKRDLRFPVMLMTAVFAAGPLGSMGVLLVSVLYPIFARYFSPLGSWIKELFPFPQPISENVFTRIKIGWDDYTAMDEVSLFRDIFQFGTLAQKQTVLDKMVEHFDPIYSPLLKQALEDPSNLIRIQAASIVTKISYDFEGQLNKQLAFHNDHPKDSEGVLSLAKLLDAYAFTGFLDPDRESDNQKQSLFFYRKYLDKHPDHDPSWINMGRLLFRQKDYEGVLRWFENYQSQRAHISGNALCWYLEALYMLGNYDKLSNLALDSLPELEKTFIPEDILESVKGWAHV